MAILKIFQDFVYFWLKVADLDVIAYTYRHVSIRKLNRASESENIGDIENLNLFVPGVLRFLLVLLGLRV